ncbi:hypothetical protein SAY86_020958 [Trapa natans]|uniref:SLC26A/SulP transporter domain-containing protein n=1 Tax=Trapa natans TaxID=22666 RepID=A0AAN7M9Q5_TRANT|nr:hypothetical protein SAY86_020958 [Trapa natans]
MASVGHLSEEEKEAMNEQQIHKVGIPPRQNLFKEFSSTLKETLFADDPLRPFKDQPGSRKFLLGIQTLFPIFEWGRSYNLNKFKGDLIAGLTIASLCIPQVERNIIIIPVQGSRFIHRPIFLSVICPDTGNRISDTQSLQIWIPSMDFVSRQTRPDPSP